MAATLGLGLAWAASRVDGSVPFAPLSLADRVVRLAPGDVATFFIERLGHDAVRLLALAVTLALVALGALVPALLRPGRTAPRWSGLVFSLALLAAGLADPLRPPPLAVLLASSAAGILYWLALEWLQASSSADSEGPAISRRQAIAWIAASTGALAVGGSAVGRWARRLRGPDRNVPIEPADVVAPVPARASFPAIAGLSPEVTSAADHYVVDIDIVDPVVEADGWRLKVGGAVSRARDLDFSTLQREFPMVEEYSALTCISNDVGGDLVGSSKWTGPRLRDVLAAAEVAGDASEVLFRCADGYTAVLPLERALDPSVLLGVAHNGRPLLQEHGFPCRLRAPDVYGMLNPKWLQEVRVLTQDTRGFWAQRGWSRDGVVRTESRIDTRNDVPAGRPTWIAGVAWAGGRGISAVEVSVDGGRSWESARLHRPLSRYAWTQWAWPWTPPQAGVYPVLCRATDGTGRRQDPRRRPPHPSGASGYHRIALRAV